MAQKKTILVADDDASIRMVISQALVEEGYKVRATGVISALRKWISEGEGDLLVSDVFMPDGSIFDVLPRIKFQRPELPVIVISGESTLETANNAFDSDVAAYLPKPFDIDALVKSVGHAAKSTRTKSEVTPRKSLDGPDKVLIGRSAAMQDIYGQLARLKDAPEPVLIIGDTGTGKTLLARTMHRLSRQASTPFIHVRSTLLERMETLQDEATFERVIKETTGLDDGTLFLENVNELAAREQSQLQTLCKALSTPSSYRLIATANSDLEGLVAKGEFSKSLYFQLSSLTIKMPSLTDRREDIRDLSYYFLQTLAQSENPPKLGDRLLEVLAERNWVGNVLELKAIITRLFRMGLLSNSLEAQKLINAQPDFSHSEKAALTAEELINGLMAQHFDRYLKPGNSDDAYAHIMQQIEAPLIRRVLANVNGNKLQAAKILGLNRNTLRSKMTALGLDSN